MTVFGARLDPAVLGIFDMTSRVSVGISMPTEPLLMSGVVSSMPAGAYRDFFSRSVRYFVSLIKQYTNTEAQRLKNPNRKKTPYYWITLCIRG